jgi:hypothetical protein
MRFLKSDVFCVRVARYLVALLLVVTCSAEAAKSPRQELYWSNLTGGQYNPVGIGSFFQFTYRLRLMDRDAPILEENFVGLGMTLDITPVWLRGGVHFHIQPLSILKMGVEILGLQGFGVLGSAQAFNSPLDDWSQEVMDAQESEAAVISAWAVRSFFQLRFAWKAFRIRNTTLASYWNHRLPPGDTAVFAAGIAGLRPQRGWTIENKTEMGFLFLDDRLLVGVRHWMVNSFHPGFSDDPNGPSHILGPGIGWTFTEASSAVFNKPTLLFHVGWYINHTNRVGELPYIALALYFDGRLWSSD